MSIGVLKRFIVLMAVLTALAFFFWEGIISYVSRPPGDYYTEMGANRLQDKLYEQALESFDKALDESPNHRGAIMGRAITYMQTGQFAEAEAEFTYLISHLNKTLESDDATGKAVLAAAYANRGILYDRQEKFKKAVKDYVSALNTDAEAVEGPGIVNKLLYGMDKPSTVRDRAIYIAQQLKLPERERLLRIPEKDAMERMYKPY